jgi:hypothetical protein
MHYMIVRPGKVALSPFDLDNPRPLVGKAGRRVRRSNRLFERNYQDTI